MATPTCGQYVYQGQGTEIARHGGIGEVGESRVVAGSEARAPIHMDIAVAPLAVGPAGRHRDQLFLQKQLAHHARPAGRRIDDRDVQNALLRSEEETSELQSLMRISSAVFCLIKKNVTIATKDWITSKITDK